MALTENIGIELVDEMVDQFGKSFEEMTSHRESLSESLFEDIKEHFLNIQRSHEQKFEELETKERAFEKKKSEYHTLLEEREAAVGLEEQSLCDRLQVVRDAAVSSIIEARKKSNEASPLPENKVSSSATIDATLPAPEESIPINKSTEAMTGELEPRSRLNQLCEEMNVKGLLKFFSDHRKNIIPLRDELPIALRSASEPAHFVLKTLEGFYPQNPPDINSNSKEYSNLQSLRRTSLLLMESAAPLLSTAEIGDDHRLSDEIKRRAKVIADEWKHKLAELDLDASNGYSLEAEAFLQLLATFNISLEFEEDELCKLVIAISRRRRKAPELCRAVGLTHKSQDIVGALITKGRLMDAVHFSYFFGLTEVFPLVPLLKQYMDETEETFTRSIAVGLEKEAANQELSALKTVIRCIEEYKLQEEYPLLPLQTRIDQLERTRAGKKRIMDGTRVPAKKHRPYEARSFHRTPNRFSGPSSYERTRYYTGREGYPYTASAAAAGATRYVHYTHQANAPTSYHYPNERAPPYGGPPMQSTVPGGTYMSPGMHPASANYGSFMGSSFPPSQQSYMQFEQ